LADNSNSMRMKGMHLATQIVADLARVASQGESDKARTLSDACAAIAKASSLDTAVDCASATTVHVYNHQSAPLCRAASPLPAGPDSPSTKRHIDNSFHFSRTGCPFIPILSTLPRPSLAAAYSLADGSPEAMFSAIIHTSRALHTTGPHMTWRTKRMGHARHWVYGRSAQASPDDLSPESQTKARGL
jgi:hypothetical protein